MIESTSYKLRKLVTTLDRKADKLVRAKFNLTYKRALFLIVLQSQGPMRQHALALCLGYSDPAISTMLIELAKLKYLKVSLSEAHGRHRIVSLTNEGSELATKVRQMLDSEFAKLLASADVDSAKLNLELTKIEESLLN